MTVTEVPTDASVLQSGSPYQRSRTRTLARRYATNKMAVFGAIYLLLLVLVAIFAPLIATHDPNKQDLLNRLNAGSGILGTDDFGRDQFSRLVYGARVSLTATFIAIGVAAGIGVPLGMLAGYFGRWVDAVPSRISEALQSVPALVFALTVIAVLGPGLTNAMIAVGIVTIPRFFRVARAATQEVTAETFVESSRSLGCSTTRVLGKHVFPNVLSPLVVQVSVTLALVVAAEASLSFLGLGVRPPTASWGSMLSTASSNLRQAPHLVWPPGIMIALTVLAFTFIGDGLQRALGTRRIPGAGQ